MQTVWAFIIAVLGLAIGSFLNVCIYRIPKGMSLLYPPSHCPYCGNRIKFYDNIPLVSYIVLGGKCRYCKHPIPFRYFLVELLTGVLFLLAYLRIGLSFELLRNLVFISVGECIAFIDAEKMIVPDIVTLPTILLGLIMSFYPGGISFVSALIGAVSGAIVMLIFRLLGKAVFKREALGDGDIVIISMIGIFTGPMGVFISILFGSLLGSIIGIFLLIKNKTEILPFGPFLIFGAFLYIYLFQFTKYLTIG